MSEEATAALRQAHEADLAAKEEGLSELRGENRLLKASIESLERDRASSNGAGIQDSIEEGSDELSSRSVVSDVNAFTFCAGA